MTHPTHGAGDVRAIDLALDDRAKGPSPDRIVRAYTTAMPGLYAHRSVGLNGIFIGGWQISTGQGLYVRGGFRTRADALTWAAEQHPDLNWQTVTAKGWKRRQDFDPRFVRLVFDRMCLADRTVGFR